jgi:23S rRNA (cytidine1920-2'-O)/16S rRNA (cytidine1409-2'-O)-methyltransferase
MMSKESTLLKLLRRKYKNKTKEQLLAHILCGDVRVNDEKLLNPKEVISEKSVVTIRKSHRFVSRGGDKLDNVLDKWLIDVKGKTIIDAGCSTGGFTDCLLKRGVSLIYAVDVGFNQLDYSLRVHPDVCLMEKMNVLYLRQEMFPQKPQAAVMDLSFRSVRGAAAHLLGMLEEKWLIALIKPQFEWQNPVREFNGVIRDKSHHSHILLSLIEDLALENVYVNRVAASPLKGRKGNNEFFFFLEPLREKTHAVLKREIASLLKQL